MMRKVRRLVLVLAGPRTGGTAFLAMGDSLDGRIRLPAERRFCLQTQNWLDQTGDGDVIKRGLSGIPPAGGLSRLPGPDAPRWMHDVTLRRRPFARSIRRSAVANSDGYSKAGADAQSKVLLVASGHRATSRQSIKRLFDSSIPICRRSMTRR